MAVSGRTPVTKIQHVKPFTMKTWLMSINESLQSDSVVNTFIKVNVFLIGVFEPSTFSCFKSWNDWLHGYIFKGIVHIITLRFSLICFIRELWQHNSLLPSLLSLSTSSYFPIDIAQPLYYYQGNQFVFCKSLAPSNIRSNLYIEIIVPIFRKGFQIRPLAQSW